MDDTGPSDEVLRWLWREMGGSFHGPNVEHGIMPEAKLLPLLRQLLSPPNTNALRILRRRGVTVNP